MYKVNGKEFNYDSYINQKIKHRLVGEEVCGNVTDVVEFIISASNYEHMIGTEAPFNHDDIVNMYIDHQDEIDELDKYKEEFEEWADELEDEIVEELACSFDEDEIVEDMISEYRNDYIDVAKEVIIEEFYEDISSSEIEDHIKDIAREKAYE